MKLNSKIKYLFYCFQVIYQENFFIGVSPGKILSDHTLFYLIFLEVKVGINGKYSLLIDWEITVFNELIIWR